MSSFLQRLRYYLLILSDRQTPWYVKLILGIGLVYIIVPMDLIADTIPLFGWLDDLAVASFIVAVALRLVPQEVMARVQRKVLGGR
ncbi:MAG: YkvA family protein [Desulfobulbales bacterium]